MLQVGFEMFISFFKICGQMPMKEQILLLDSVPIAILFIFLSWFTHA